MASIGVKVIRRMFGAAEVVAPYIAGRAAFALFCRTPNPMRLTLGEKRAVDRAASFMETAHRHQMNVGGRCVAAHEFLPRGGWDEIATVLVLHGWRSRTEYMKALVEAYRDEGYRVISLDMPGHGASSGRRLTVVDAVQAVNAADLSFGPFAAVIGHSFGGAIAVNAVAGAIAGIAPLAASKLVLIAAPSSMPDVFDRFGHHLKLGPRTRLATERQMQRMAGRPLNDFVGSRLLTQTALPTLVIHAPDDREVLPEQAEHYASAGGHVRLRWAPGLGHRRILSDPGVVDAALKFVTGAQPGLH